MSVAERVRSALKMGKWARLAVAGAVLGTAAGVGVAVWPSTPTYPLTAVFASAHGLFSGAAVEVLGVRVGTVESVSPQAGHVVVKMSIDSIDKIPADATASLVAAQILGEPNIELSPGYGGGRAMPAGSVIPESHTTVPVSTSELLSDLQSSLEQINPKGVKNLVTNLAQDLNGQGQQLNQLISGAAGTLKVLAAKGDDLGQLDGSLAQITGTLRSQTAQLTQLITDYDTVSGVLATNSGALGQAINRLSLSSAQLAQLLAPNLAPLQGDLATVATTGRTLDRNISSLNEILASSVRLFSAAKRAYDPTHNWLNLNLQSAPGVTSGEIAGMIRDRLAGVCRRILANHSAGLSSKEISTLKECGNPASGFFDPIMGLVPGILNSLPGGSTSASGTSSASSAPAPTTAGSLFEKGLAKIPGLTPAERAAITTAPSAQSSAGSSSSSSSQPSSSSPSGSSVKPSSPSIPVLKSPLLNISLSADKVLGPLPRYSAPPTASSGVIGGVLHALASSAAWLGRGVAGVFGGIGHWLSQLWGAI